MAERRERHGGWGLFLLFWTMLLLMLGFLGCLFFYKYAADYEATRPEKCMDELMASMSEDDWHDALAPTAGEVSRYENVSALFDGYFDNVVRGRTLSYRRDMSRSDKTRTTFILYAGPARIGEVRLVPDGDELRFGFGRSQWTLESVTSTPITDSLQALTVQIDAPDGVTPVLNGVALGQEDIIDPAVALTELSELEQRFASAGPRMVRYEFGPLYGQIAVSDAEGNEYAPVGEPENGLLRYVIPPTTRYSFRVEAPEGVTVYASGAELGEEQISVRDDIMFRGLGDYLPEGGYDTLLYAVDGLYTEPEISASYNGTALTPILGEDGRLIFLFPDDDNISIAMHEAVEGFFEAYLRFTSNKYKGVDLKNLRDRVLNGTELDKYFAESYDGMIWASATQMDREELKFDNFHRVGENCFTCTIHYRADFTATQWYGTDSYEREDGYKMVFVRENGVWLAASMSAFE